MSILERIIATKQAEVNASKQKTPVSALGESAFFYRKILSLKAALEMVGSSGLIAEFKRKSPSSGWINRTSFPADVCRNYQNAGAQAVSVLTDNVFFGGSLADLKQVREKVDCPVLRKDFIIDEYQISEAKAAGADAVLLIAEVHGRDRLAELFGFASSLNLEVLVEVHDEKSISKIPSDARIIGINSRNLDSFAVSLDHSAEIIASLPPDTLKVAESGIQSANDYKILKKSGFDAFLIGGLFMKNDDPGAACKNFIKECSE